MAFARSHYWLSAALFLGAGLIFTQPAAAAEPTREIVGPGAAEPSSPEQWYGAGVRPTDKRTPEAQRSGFHLPPGFEIDLVAAEPQIAKPLNMAFDAKGKLWLTQTVEYPYPASGDQAARDCVKTLEDTDGDGDMDRVVTFADGLNIPIGLLPFADGVIVFSIPNLIHLRDTDGDGACDRRDLILGPFDTSRDTHGMVNSLRRGDDGWIYACHGFSNQSTVAGSDGHAVSMTSGNTFRFRPDGSRIERFTAGQVNPFGMTIDSWGNRFTADCHSKPITCLVHGACYPSFGRPHDGLGFFPSMMDHAHGSTAISGLCLYDAHQFPEPYRGQLYSGNVMTSRINRDAIERTGATFKAIEVGDFLTSDDPWFRPVDIQLGPDGSLYVADFYNRIIGHYEVPLEHPGRDRDSGRIWRIRYAGLPAATALPGSRKDRPSEQYADLFAELADPNASRRQLALDRLSDEYAFHPDQVDEMAVQALAHPEAWTRTGAMWLLHRQHRLSSKMLIGLLRDRDALVRHHALRAWAESENASKEDRSLILPIARSLLDDAEPLVKCAAAQGLAIHGEPSDAALLVERIKTVAPTDTMQLARLRISLRDLLARQPAGLTALQATALPSADRDIYLSVVLGLPTAAAVEAIIAELGRAERPIASMLPWIDHAAKQADAPNLDRLISIVRRRSETSPSERNAIFARLKLATGGKTTTALVDWADSVAAESVDQMRLQMQSGRAPISWQSESETDWGSESRQAADNQNQFRYCSSLSMGEPYVGSLRSDAFVAEGEVSFWLVGHNGPPQADDARLNQVRLVDATNGQILRSEFPPRSDVATKVTWDLTPWSGQSVRIEAIDAHSGKAYAWIAIGRFEPVHLDPLSSFQQQWTQTLQLISLYRLKSQTAALQQFASLPELGSKRRLQAIQASAELSEDATTKTIAQLLLRFPNRGDVIDRFLEVATQLGDEPSVALEDDYKKLVRELSTGLAQRDQLTVARTLAAQSELAEWLIAAIEDGWLSPGLLHDKAVEIALDSTVQDTERPRIASLLQSAGPERDELIRLQDQVLKTLSDRAGDVTNGQAIFQKQCGLCHQIGGQGSLVGPQLDGIGARGHERLLEDILFPDRNVDKAFRTTSFLLDDGTVRVGLVRSESDSTIELIENNGEVRQLDTTAVISRRLGSKSLMPDGQHQTLGTDGLVDLLAYLQKTATKTP
ncbi:MAG: PVC-type heme-binding CxxCH protein [Planctomycetaceae bacterium]